ncbi:hypothetical protein [Cohnella nanjingensis]|uniref:Polymer-forming cytoskeletal protein n=1 Tax=Cohnella nanjingensis TaxID=1387779 RepID=A0A7X0RWM3_9BACL|nr:hypothetical protein [Cohnella nanjingensis]MBB6674976.1 hypothetical protein [Cohnella nanjingensis]
MNAARSDVRMVGTTSSVGGVLGKVRIIGECEMYSDTDCTRLNCVGEAKVQGHLRVEGTLKLTGECKITGALQAGEIRGTGNLEIQSGIRGDVLKFSGNLDTDGDCELEKADLSGAFRVAGLLNAGRLNLNMYGPCRAQEIGGGFIRIRKSKVATMKGWINSDGAARLHARVIEGDIVELHHTDAGIVRGNRVIIGAGCKIGRIEYRQELRVDRHSEVKERVQL